MIEESQMVMGTPYLIHVAILSYPPIRNRQNKYGVLILHKITDRNAYVICFTEYGHRAIYPAAHGYHHPFSILCHRPLSPSFVASITWIKHIFTYGT